MLADQGEGRTVFVVEDDLKIAAVLQDYAEAAGYDVLLFQDGRGVISAVREAPPSAILLDLMLPGIDGTTVCREIRTFSDVPIIMLTARVDELDRIAGLDLGADDYICKPFSAKEVMSRLRAHIRRAEGNITQLQRDNRLFVADTASQRISWRGQWLPLSPAEYTIASAMMNQPGRVYTRDQLLDKLGDRSDESSDRAIDSHIKNIRKKMVALDPHAKCFVAVYGVGYRFELP